MATITNRLGPFTGHVGPVRFTKGVAETDDTDMVAYFEADPDTYDVDGVPEPPDPSDADDRPEDNPED